jgi:hypothetical protein
MRSLRLRAAVLLAGTIVLSLAAPVLAAAQDTQYWADGYGTQARLLGGTVIGSDVDISAVYYNPGAVALADSLSFLISLNALRYSDLSFTIPKVQNVPSSTGWSALSNMFAGAVPIGGKDSRERLAFSLLTRQSFTFNAQLRAIPLDSFIPVPPPPPTFSDGNALVSQSLTETWAGATWATERDKHWGFGASMFVAIRAQTWSQSVSAQVVNGVGQTALAVREYDFSYYNWGLLLKLGAQYKGDDWGAGITITTPRVDLFGGSDVGATRSYIDQGVAGPPSSQIATDYQPNLGANFHSPLAIGLGYGKRWKKTSVTLAVEWFAAVPKFTIITAQPFDPQTGGAPIDMSLTAQYRQLVNWGVGVQHFFSPHWTGYAAFRTDLTAIPTGVKSVGTLINFNLMHANLGVQATIGRASIILGLDTAWGSQDGVTAAGDPAPGLPALPTVSESYFNITGALGFKFTY